MQLNANCQTMCAVSYIRGYLLDELRSKQLITPFRQEGKRIAEAINHANGGMFTRTIEVRNYYYQTMIAQHQNEFEQLLILGIGLDTKADTLRELQDKTVFGIDRQAQEIQQIYHAANLKTRAIIVNGDLNQIGDSTLLTALQSAGFSLTKRTYLLWEGGTYYLTPSAVLGILAFWCQSINVVGISADLLNKTIFEDKRHPYYAVIQQVLTILAQSREPWRGFFTPMHVHHCLAPHNFNQLLFETHGVIERKLYKNPRVIEDLLFFVTAFQV